ncbi:hypothetical protein [Streptomyces sp. LS1784]|uniref:hypothetical protein n=1 Tax=Streptomyces sp. LS1784 TaxID=2851533 RepID=UPI001CC99423|nr:hypothetical protein [Streptomyces sp. LS1784]
MRALARVVWRRKELVLLPGVATVVVGGLLSLLVWAEVWAGGLVAGAALCLGAAVTVTASVYGVFRAALYREPAGVVTATAPGPVLRVSEVE